MKRLLSFNTPFTALILAAILPATLSADIAFDPSEDGLYAVFSTTRGEFAAELYYDLAPITVANFVGLAEGSVLRWDNDEKEAITGPYYDGVIFHRVIDNFVIQGGDPTGTGSGGPGYPIPDEIDPELSHDKAGLLSMAKGGPNSGGSQFFITLDPVNNSYPTHLDGNHTIFGEIVSGMGTVEEIGGVEVNNSAKPTTDVVIETITILRVGEGAASFDPRNYDVPNVFYPDIELNTEEGTAQFARKHYASYYIRRSTDLVDWELDESVTPEYDAPLTHEIDLSDDFEGEGRSFLRVTELTNIHSLDADGTELTVSLNNNPDMEIEIGEDFGGTYEFGEISSGELVGYVWYPLVDRDQLHVGFSGLRDEMQLYLTWTSETEGTVFARVINTVTGSAFNLTGTFTANSRPTDG